jgi:predicted SprT family Zn-dependent metalloprotease
MNLFEAEILAKELISEYVPDCSFKWSRSKTRYGDFTYSTRVLRLSSILTKLRPKSEVRTTIMHEIAHALTPHSNHGRAWQLQMMRFGLPPERCSHTEADLKLLNSWIGVCPNNHEIGGWTRKPNAVRSCSKCHPRFNRAYLITYKQIR